MYQYPIDILVITNNLQSLKMSENNMTTTQTYMWERKRYQQEHKIKKRELKLPVNLLSQTQVWLASGTSPWHKQQPPSRAP